jgi:hypothetical protein
MKDLGIPQYVYLEQFFRVNVPLNAYFKSCMANHYN